MYACISIILTLYVSSLLETNKSGVKAISLIAGSAPLSYFSIIKTGIGFYRQDQQLSTSVNNVNITTQTIMLAISSCNGLIVFNLATATDQELFKKVRIPGTVINSLAMIFGNHFVPERVVTTNESNKSKSTAGIMIIALIGNTLMIRKVVHTSYLWRIMIRNISYFYFLEYCTLST